VSNCRRHLCALVCLASLVAGCRSRSTHGTLVVTQVPPQSRESSVPRKLLDLRYPIGTRIVAARPDKSPRRAKLLSQNLIAAGDPRLSPDGTQVLFCGKSEAGGPWQIYRTDLEGNAPQRLTEVAGGAMDPAWLPDGRFLFASPVPGLPQAETLRQAPAIYAQRLDGGPAERLTSAAGATSQCTVLRDGRILFVAELNSPAGTHDGLFTINSDGTEVTAFAALHDHHSRIRRPRELPDGRVVFLAKRLDPPTAAERLEQVELRRPFSSRQTVAPLSASEVLSAEPGIHFSLLAGFAPGTSPELSHATTAIAGLDGETGKLHMLFDDPDWNDLEAVQCAERMQPMGRLSTVNRDLNFGRILCLNANLSQTSNPTAIQAGPTASRIRFLTLTPEGQERDLGETDVHPDGSFLVELPADQPLGLETLDADGRVIQRLHASFWVRPGENRACIGCHEPHNQSPDNFRPLAVKEPPVRIGLDSPPTVLAGHP